jgi:hypothetical protein
MYARIIIEKPDGGAATVKLEASNVRTMSDLVSFVTAVNAVTDAAIALGMPAALPKEKP